MQRYKKKRKCANEKQKNAQKNDFFIKMSIFVALLIRFTYVNDIEKTRTPNDRQKESRPKQPK